MNCRPGDLAIIIRAPYAGMMVEVLYEAPTRVYHTLPDDQRHGPCPPGNWVVKSLGSPFNVRLSIGHDISTRVTQYACCTDAALRPLRGEPETEEFEQGTCGNEMHSRQLASDHV
jgi:hypothetical protein